MNVGLGDRRREPTAVDLPPGTDPDRVARAVRGEPVRGIDVEAPDPGPVHEYVGLLDGTGVHRFRAALAAAARSRGLSAPQDDAIADCRDRLSALDPPEVDTERARRRVAEAGERERRLAERVAELRGRVRALESTDQPERLEDASDRLEAATTELTEVRTERIAAEQALDRAERRARGGRDRRERRLRLEDRIGNLRREAREHLAGAVAAEFAASVAAVPGDGAVGDDPTEFEGDPTTAAMAIARVAELRAPLVVACGRFPDAATAAEVLEAPAIRVPDAPPDGRESDPTAG